MINVPVLQKRFRQAKQNGYLSSILDEMVRQSKVEFHYED